MWWPTEWWRRRPTSPPKNNPSPTHSNPKPTPIGAIPHPMSDPSSKPQTKSSNTISQHIGNPCPHSHLQNHSLPPRTTTMLDPTSSGPPPPSWWETPKKECSPTVHGSHPLAQIKFTLSRLKAPSDAPDARPMWIPTSDLMAPKHQSFAISVG